MNNQQTPITEERLQGIEARVKSEPRFQGYEAQGTGMHNAYLTDVPELVAEVRRLRAESARHFRWSYRLLLCLAKRLLADANDESLPGCWPAGQSWHQLTMFSHSIFFHRARDQAGISSEEFLEPIRANRIDVRDLYDAAADGLPLPADAPSNEGDPNQGEGATP